MFLLHELFFEEKLFRLFSDKREKRKKMLFEHKNFLILSSREDALVYKNRFEIGKKLVFKSRM
ncbi:hypothetical protein LEP1GSC188_1845 [Leptospira weilii serovar Topaz str. LT2116]|uniref:Uncharacterized protein n=1 Tax=Leptospira weilii serovar Topaz str. LT2116 TaxID=1088540 RepID=M3G1P8_9LEPT|nr:hypothetical protein LEP1GSC188_1845 [Leptospira weilii serovar Topaz str. LT2116]